MSDKVMGNLYRTMAPKTGVVQPIINPTKILEIPMKMMRFMYFEFLVLVKAKSKSNKMKYVSTTKYHFTSDFGGSFGVGRKKALNKALGMDDMRFEKLPSIGCSAM